MRLALALAFAVMTLLAFVATDELRPAVVVVAGLGAAILVVLGRRAAAAARAAARGEWLAAAFDAESGARLAVGPEGELRRNGPARSLFAGADDPLSGLRERAAGDERTLEELDRLRAAASIGIAESIEISLSGGDGGREWWSLSVRPMTTPAGAVLWRGEEVTGRRAIEETLRREHEMLTDFLDFLPVGCYSADTEGRFRYVNLRLAEWLGRTPDALVGMDMREVLGVVPDPEDDRAEMRLRGKGGDVFQAFVSHAVYDDAGETLTRSVVVRDLMPERMWERALKSAERRVKWLFDDAPVGIAMVDPDGIIGMTNRALQGMLGLDDDGAGRQLLDLVAPEDRAAAADLFSRVLMGTAPSGHMDLRLLGRGELVATVWVNPAAEDGSISGLMAHFLDTTEQKNLEIQFAQSQKMQAMGQLAGGVAHDFNNLLTAMIGFCDLMLQRHGPGDASFADIMQIKQNANRAASLVRQLLAFSRRQTMTPQPLSVTDALAELSSLLRRLLGERIALEMVHGRDVGLVRVDPGQFDQVVINLAVNARDAMAGGGTLAIRTDSKILDKPMQRGHETVPPGRYVVLEVRDTGHGIAKENLSRIFEPFFSTKAVGAGTGLGLSTVYGIVRQTEGFIFVDSEIGAGTTFSIWLPRYEAPEEARPGRAPEPAPAERDLTGAGTIMLVEDEDAVRLFAGRALRNKGYTVTEAASGEGAIELLKDAGAIDVLITDVVMPGMDGATLARLVRSERPETRVIMISGYSEDVAFDGLSDDPAVRFLPKPFSLKQLASAVKEALDGAE